jgi:hypothetical protein
MGVLQCTIVFRTLLKRGAMHSGDLHAAIMEGAVERVRRVSPLRTFPTRRSRLWSFGLGGKLERGNRRGHLRYWAK